MAYFDLNGKAVPAGETGTEPKANQANPVILEDDTSNWNFKRYDASGKLQETIEEKGTVRVPVDWTLEGALAYFKAKGAENPSAAVLGAAIKAERINCQSAARQKRAEALGITVPKVYDEDKAVKGMVKQILAAYASRGAAITAEEANQAARKILLGQFVTE